MIYEVKFGHGETNAFADSETALEVQEGVIVRSDKGMNYGRIIREIPTDTALEVKHMVLRKANEEDELRVKTLNDLALEAKTRVRQLVLDQKLEMKIIEVAYNYDQTQLFISFTAENRVDFRVLLRELAAYFRIRIELRQIGPRDAAKIYGGLGPCGRPLCCSEFVYEFPNVSIKMAKNQNLSLKQSKLNGLCGRLMCCLTYEEDFYKEAQEFFPDFGEKVVTAEGTGKVIGLNVLKNSVKIRFGEYSKEFELAEVEVNRG